MAFQFLAPLAPVLKLAGGVALVNTVNDLLQLPNIKIGTNNPETDVGKILGDRLFNNFNNYMRGRTGSSTPISNYDKHQGAGLDMDEIRRLGLLYQNVSTPTPTPTPVVVPVIEGMSEWEAAKKAQDMALADQLGMEIWARENPGLAAAVAERARIRGTNQTDNPLMRDFRSQLPSPTDSTATTGIPATPGFQSLLENLEKIAKADDGTSLVAPEKPIDPKILLKNKGEPVEPFRN